MTGKGFQPVRCLFVEDVAQVNERVRVQFAELESNAVTIKPGDIAPYLQMGAPGGTGQKNVNFHRLTQLEVFVGLDKQTPNTDVSGSGRKRSALCLDENLGVELNTGESSLSHGLLFSRCSGIR
jgi:hypothetical protein